MLLDFRREELKHFPPNLKLAGARTKRVDKQVAQLVFTAKARARANGMTVVAAFENIVGKDMPTSTLGLYNPSLSASRVEELESQRRDAAVRTLRNELETAL